MGKAVKAAKAAVAAVGMALDVNSNATTKKVEKLKRTHAANQNVEVALNAMAMMMMMAQMVMATTMAVVVAAAINVNSNVSAKKPGKLKATACLSRYCKRCTDCDAD